MSFILSWVKKIGVCIRLLLEIKEGIFLYLLVGLVLVVLGIRLMSVLMYVILQVSSR